jgi:hypothetical protein
MNRVYYSLRKIAYNNKFRFTNANKNKNKNKNKNANNSKRHMSTDTRGGGGGPNYDYLIPAVLVGCYMVYSARPSGGYDVKINSPNHLLTNN